MTAAERITDATLWTLGHVPGSLGATARHELNRRRRKRTTHRWTDPAMQRARDEIRRRHAEQQRGQR